MASRNEQIAQLALLTGDSVLSPLAGLISEQDAARLGREKFAFDKRQPTHLGSGFLRDPVTGRITQDPGFSEFEERKHQRALELYNAQQDSQIQRETRAEGRQLAREDRATDRAVGVNTRRLSSELARAQIPELQRGIQAIDEELEPYLQSGSDLPGMGGIFNKLPGLTSDARGMKSRVARIRNMILKARSGGAVTPQEADRLLEEFGLGMFNTDEDFLKAWGDFKTAVDAGTQNIFAGFGDETVDNYGRNLERSVGSAPTAEQPTPPAPASGDPKRVKWGDM